MGEQPNLSTCRLPTSPVAEERQGIEGESEREEVDERGGGMIVRKEISAGEEELMPTDRRTR